LAALFIENLFKVSNYNDDDMLDSTEKDDRLENGWFVHTD
jgi:hypothetical protein